MGTHANDVSFKPALFDFRVSQSSADLSRTIVFLCQLFFILLLRMERSVEAAPAVSDCAVQIETGTDGHMNVVALRRAVAHFRVALLGANAHANINFPGCPCSRNEGSFGVQ